MKMASPGWTRLFRTALMHSSSLSKGFARRVAWNMFLGQAVCLMTLPSGARLPFRIAIFAVGALGVVKAVDDILAGDFDAQTLGLFLQDLVAVLVEAVLLQVFQVSPSVLPVTVITSRCSMDLISSITRGTPPA